jgi:hypothetical protein
MRRTNATPAAVGQKLTLALTVVLTASGAAGACRSDPEISDGVSDSTFVRTMVDLRRLDTVTSLDSAARAAERAAVLQRRGLTAARLERAATSLADEPARAQKIFSRIDSMVARGRPGAAPPPSAPSSGRAPKAAVPSSGPADSAARTPAPAPPRPAPPKASR